MSVGEIQSGRVSLEAFINQLNANGHLGADGDLASVILAEQVKSRDAMVNKKLVEVRLISSARDQLNDRIALLRQALAEHKGTDKDLDEPVPTQKLGLGPGRLKQLKLEIDYGSMRVTSKDGDDISKLLVDETSINDVKREHVTGDQLDAEIKRLELQAQQLDSDREVRMITLNSDMSKRANMVQMLSNIAKRKNDADAAIINNFR